MRYLVIDTADGTEAAARRSRGGADGDAAALNRAHGARGRFVVREVCERRPRDRAAWLADCAAWSGATYGN
jgi:hypothetical protein